MNKWTRIGKSHWVAEASELGIKPGQHPRTAKCFLDPFGFWDSPFNSSCTQTWQTQQVNNVEVVGWSCIITIRPGSKHRLTIFND